MHVQEMQRMGAQLAINGQQVISQGIECLEASDVTATDLRASASLLLAGLVAKGCTTIHQIHHIDRGYEHIEAKFSLLNCSVRRVAADRKVGVDG